MTKQVTEDTIKQNKNQPKKHKRGHGEGCIREIGNGKWTARIQIGVKEDGKQKIKAFYGNSRSEVKAKLDDFISKIKNKYNTDELPCVDEYITNWLTTVKINELKPLSYDRLENTINNHIIPNIGFYKLDQLNDYIIQKELINKLSYKLSYSSIKKIYDALNACLKYALQRRDIQFNPMNTVTIPALTKYTKKDITILTEDEIIKLKNEVSKTYKTKQFVYRNGYAFILILYTGLRMGEALALKWEDYNEEEKTLKIWKNIEVIRNRHDNTKPKYILKEQHSPKTNSSYRIIPLNNTAIHALNQLEKNNINHKDSDYIIQTKYNTPVFPRDFQNTLNYICNNCSIRRIGVHTLRHTFASMLFKKGADIKTVSELLGHSSIQITYDTYIHIIDKQKTTTVNLLDDI